MTIQDDARKVSELLPQMLESDADLTSLLSYAIVELDFLSRGAYAGSVACRRFAERLSSPELRGGVVEERVERGQFDPAMAVVADRALRASEYIPTNQELTADLLKSIDSFAEELENLQSLPRERIPLLISSLRAFPSYSWN